MFFTPHLAAWSFWSKYWAGAASVCANSFARGLSEGQEKGARQHAEILAERDAREAAKGRS